MDDSKTIKGGVININDIIQSISTINNGVISIINSLTKDMSKLNSIDTKSLSNSKNTISSIIKSLQSYIGEINNLLSTIVENKNINTNSINTILDYYEEVDSKNPNKIVKSEMRLLTSISLVSKFIVDISKSIEEVSKISMPISSVIKIRNNVAQLSKSLDIILNSIIKLFSDQSRNTEIKNLLNTILPSPETIELINDIQKDIDNSEEGSNKRFIDESYDKSKTITTKANIGILDVIGIYLGFAKTLSDLQTPNLITFRFKLYQLNNSIKKVLDDIIKITPLIGNKKQANAFKQVNNSLGEIKKTIDSMINLLPSIRDLSLKLLSTYPLTFTFDYLVNSEDIGGKGSKWIQSIIEKSRDRNYKVGILTKLLIIKYFIEENWTKINKNAISTISIFISSLVDVIKKVNILSLLLLNPLLRLDLDKLVGDKLIGSIISIAEKINNERLDILADNKFKERLSNLIEFVNSIKKLITSILITSALAVLAVPTMLVVSLFMISLIPFIFIVSLITKFISKLEIGDVKDSILSIILVCGLFALVAVELVLLQVVLERVKWDDLSINLLYLLGVVGVLVGIVWIFSKVADKIKGNIYKSIITIIAVTGLFLVVGATLLALQYILDSIKWLSLLGGLLGLILVTVALAGVCALIVMYSIVFIPAVAGIILMLAVIAPLFLIAVMLKTLTLISFSEKDIKKLTAKPDDKGSGEYGVLTAVIKVIESIGDILWESDFLNLGTLALVTIKFFVMTFTVGLIFILALLLKTITTITLNVGVWNPTATTTDGTILGNISAIINTIGLINHHMTQPPVDENGKPVEQNRGLLGTIIGWISPELANIVSGLLNFTTLIVALMNVGCIYFIARILMSISELNINEGEIMGKIDMIINTIKHISDKLLYNENAPTDNATPAKDDNILKRGFNKLKSFGKSIVGAAENLISAGILASTLPNVLMLGQVVDVLNAINGLNIENKESLTNKVDSIISVVSTISTQVSQDSKVSTIDEDKVESFEDFTDSNIKLYKGINNLKVDKVTSLTKLYAQMTEFMDSIKNLDLDEITDALVNKISPALQDINKSLDNTNQSGNSVSGNLGVAQTNTPTSSVNTTSTPQTSTPTSSVNTQQKTPEELKDIVQQLQVITTALKEGIVVQGIM